MVIAAFPAAKLGTLLLKQVSKPIANFAKERAKSHPFFRKYVCMPPAQFYNWCEVKMKMWVMNLGKPVEVPKLNEAMAIELGASLLGETIIFMIAAGLLYAEYARSSRKEAAKESDRKQEMTDLQEAIRELYFQTEKQTTQINELMREVGHLEMKLAQVRPFAPALSRGTKDPPTGNSHLVNTMPNVNSPELEKLSFSPGVIVSALDYVTFALPNKIFDNR